MAFEHEYPFAETEYSIYNLQILYILFIHFKIYVPIIGTYIYPDTYGKINGAICQFRKPHERSWVLEDTVSAAIKSFIAS
jgi:hypothetical protein